MATPTESFDVIVIGAGPAGSSAAAILAMAGYCVAILEKRPFPRYRVGESMLPHCWYPLERLGLVERLDQAGFSFRKDSVQFVGTAGNVSAPFYFFQHSDHPSARTWQVKRREFDQMLLDNAIEKGGVFYPETSANQLLREGDRVVGVRATNGTGKGSVELHARVTIDCSGRESFAQLANGWRVSDPALKKIAIWTYYNGALRDPGLDEGATTVAYLPGKGWFWYIPLSDDRVSVGVVAERDYLYRDADLKDPGEILQREAKLQPWIASHLAQGTTDGEYHVTSDFSYRSRHCAEDGLVLAGDAFAFLDPVFSSGIYLALQSGVMVGDEVGAALREGDCSAARFTAYGADFCTQIEAMRRLVYAFYDKEFSFGSFLKAHPHLREALTDCLIGNLRRDFDPLFLAMSDFAEIPRPLAHGSPRIR